ncbi:MAG: VWA domain-containing protein, partial [Flavobacteriales bacterium]|nr:VWA domain-containing protein [Flavobacteriales bacterium]
MKRGTLYLLIWLTALHLLAAGAWYITHTWYEYAFTPAYWAFLLLPVMSVHYLLSRRDRQPSIIYPDVKNLRKYRSTWLDLRPNILFSLRLAALWLFIMALARPQSKTEFEDSKVEGVDIMLAIDVSESMLAKDFNPNRLEAAKVVAEQFVDKRPDDRIGLVVFQAEAFTQVPLTTDHRVLKNVLRDVRSGLLESGTAIGMGLATAVNRLKESTAKSKIIVLLTDGVDNRGSIRPLDAAALAKTYGIRVYTIGAGTRGEALQPVAMRPDGSYVFDRVK